MRETVAVVDVGSNSIKLLVAQLASNADSLETQFSETIETRISTGIGRELPSLTGAAITGGTATIVELLRMAQSYRPTKTVIVATSAVRDAINGDDFRQSVFEACGQPIRILSGSEEAHYIGLGLSCDPAIQGMTSFIQTDIGGGSLELIRFEEHHMQQAISLQLGAVRLSERFIEDREAPLLPETERALREHVAEVIAASDFDFGRSEWPLVATGGAYTVSRAVLAAQAGLEMDASSPFLRRAALDGLRQQLVALPLHERLSIPHLPAARADILPTALITIDTLLECAQREGLTHSLYNLRYGIAADLLGLRQFA
ncbi:MAG: phosphatase [Verrucomicrobia bacterium]|jgi:exopolyphosphatase/guanosine-5'-triphosphate,3'-diphosphate pyrophosphatase|nr:phosphatase [Verrucomicrobiota bacterium]